jgi:peptidoglycan/LPS O-acetylase OafA/YrhL
MNSAHRLPAMDNLRALAMLGGVLFHASLAHSPLMYPLWPTADAGQSAVIDLFAWFLHGFRMPVFFLVAGYFSAHLLARHGMSGLFRQRGARVLLPLLVFLPLASLAMQELTLLAVANSAQPSPILRWVREHLDVGGALPLFNGWMHLWFLFYLLVFTLCAWIVVTLGLTRIGDRLATMSPAALALLIPIMLTPALAAAGVPWPAPAGFLPTLWAMVYFGTYFALGACLFRHADLIERLRSATSLLLAGGLLAYALSMPWRGGSVPESALAHGALLLLEAASGCWMTLWCLLAANHWLGARRRVLRWLADASYWTYLIHLPVLFGIQYRLMDVALPWPTKWLLATTLTLGFCLVSYQWLVRDTALGRLLDGRLFVTRTRALQEGAA